VLPSAAVDRLLEQCWSIDTLDNVGEIVGTEVITG